MYGDLLCSKVAQEVVQDMRGHLHWSFLICCLLVFLQPANQKREKD